MLIILFESCFQYLCITTPDCLICSLCSSDTPLFHNRIHFSCCNPDTPLSLIFLQQSKAISTLTNVQVSQLHVLGNYQQISVSDVQPINTQLLQLFQRSTQLCQSCPSDLNFITTTNECLEFCQMVELQQPIVADAITASFIIYNVPRLSDFRSLKLPTLLITLSSTQSLLPKA